MSSNELEICSPIFKLEKGFLLNTTIPILNWDIIVPPSDITLWSPFCILANKVFDILMALGDKWAREFYEQTEE